jgi:ABC-type transport system involved in cytochrome bd biosynthesis fused ATPase/permease subunit
MCSRQVPLRLHIIVHPASAALLMGAAVAVCHAQCASAQCALLHVVAQLAVGILLPTLALMYAQRTSAQLSAQLLE